MFGSTVAVPFLVTEAMCAGSDLVSKSEIIGTTFFVGGIATLLQTTLGIRLPIVQSSTFAFLVPTIAILSLPKWRCPAQQTEETHMNGNYSGNYTMRSLHENDTAPLQYYNQTVTVVQQHYNETVAASWQLRMREIQGAVLVASLFQVVIGATGIAGLLLRYIGPLTIAPTLTLIGISLFVPAAEFSASFWWISIMTVILIILFSQYLYRLNVPCVGFSKEKKCHVTWAPIFKLFPIILAVFVAWFISFILTVTNALPRKGWGFKARTDANIDVLFESKWFRFPYPGQWGLPTVSVAGVFGMLAGVLASMIESIGDYYACAKLSGAPPPPVHAINRGILIEGIGCILAGLWGTGGGVTSYSENIGAIGITKVASRKVVQVAAVIMICLGMFGKFGALFVTIPQPIVGGVFMVMFGIVTAVGLSNLQYVDLNSSRNLFIVGFSIFFGISFPQWMSRNPESINTGSILVDQILTVLFSTGMLVGGVVAVILDNTIPGTDEERGLTNWNRSESPSEDNMTCQSENCYDLPFGMNRIRSWQWTRVVPFCPAFKETSSGQCVIEKSV